MTRTDRRQPHRAVAASEEGDCVHDRVARWAQGTPEATAVVDDRERLSYAELDAAARSLAMRLASAGVRPGDRVVVLVERDARAVACLLGVLHAGAAYVPLDPQTPARRIDLVIDDAEAVAVVTADALADRLPTGLPRVVADRLPTGLPRLVAEDRALADPPAEGPSTARSRPDDLMYLIYTSGTTGRPKGVMVEHRSATALIDGLGQLLGLDARAVVLASSSFAFDVSVFEVFAPLLCGGTVVVAGDADRRDPARFEAAVRRNGVTVVSGTPTVFQMLLDAGLDLPPRLLVLTAGESLSRALAQRLAAFGTLWNLYGPTEATVYVTAHRWDPDTPEADGDPPIGRPVAGTYLRVLDADGRPVAPGEVGELHIGGPLVTRGYHNRKDLTDERFVADHLASSGGGRLYRSGDLVRQRADGQYEFVGRVDRQIKLHGHRIELEEIEATLLEHESVAAAAVKVWEPAPDDRRLVAYTQPSLPTLDTGAVRAFLRARLPAYMVPAHLFEIERLPLSPNAKIDRDALPDPAVLAGLRLGQGASEPGRGRPLLEQRVRARLGDR